MSTEDTGHHPWNHSPLFMPLCLFLHEGVA